MNRVSAGDLGGGDDAGDIEVRLACRSGTDADVVIGEADVQRFPIRLGVHRNRLDSELAARAYDSQRNLASIRDQNFFEHLLSRCADAGRQERTSWLNESQLVSPAPATP